MARSIRDPALATFGRRHHGCSSASFADSAGHHEPRDSGICSVHMSSDTMTDRHILSGCGGSPRVSVVRQRGRSIARPRSPHKWWSRDDGLQPIWAGYVVTFLVPTLAPCVTRAAPSQSDAERDHHGKQGHVERCVWPVLASRIRLAADVDALQRHLWPWRCASGVPPLSLWMLPQTPCAHSGGVAAL